MELTYLPKAWKRGTDFLGTRYAILCGAMTWVSESSLVSAISNAGGFGVLAGGNMPPDLLAKEIAATRARTRYPFGVNMITVAPNFRAHIDVVVRERAPFAIFAGSIPSGKDIEQVKAAGARVICFAPVLSLARRMIKQGADALVIEGNEAGGHIGPVATSVLAQEFLLNVTEIPVFVAGGIGTAEIIAQYRARRDAHRPVRRVPPDDTRPGHPQRGDQGLQPAAAGPAEPGEGGRAAAR